MKDMLDEEERILHTKEKTRLSAGLVGLIPPVEREARPEGLVRN